MRTRKVKHINESELRLVITESVRKLLCESQESKSISQAKALVMQRLKYNEQQADEFVRVKLRHDIPALKTPNGGKFILGATRMFLDNELTDARTINTLNKTLKFVSSDAHVNEYDRNLNGMNADELISRFAKAIEDNAEENRNKVNAMSFDTPSRYEIVPIGSFEQAEEYGDYTPWCVTHDEEMFDDYTDDGLNQFYFCLRDDYQSVKEAKGEGCPLDDYGLSMIAVCVDEAGALSTCTCRWNHDNGGNDNIMDEVQISQVVGVNFYTTFKPNMAFQNELSRITQQLRNGADPRRLFDDVERESDSGFRVVSLHERCNYLKPDFTFLSPTWFDVCKPFNKWSEFACVGKKEKENLINKQGELISKTWFDRAYSMREGYAVVMVNGKQNFIGEDGKYLTDMWFDYAQGFKDGFSLVCYGGNVKNLFYPNYGGRYNFIDTQGNLLTQDGFDYAVFFKEGAARVCVDDKWNWVDTDGNIVSDIWFDSISDFAYGRGGRTATGRLDGQEYSVNLDNGGKATPIENNDR